MMSDKCGKRQEQGLSSCLEKPFVQQSLKKSDIVGLYLLFFHLNSFYCNGVLALGCSQLAIAEDQRLELAYTVDIGLGCLVAAKWI